MAQQIKKKFIENGIFTEIQGNIDTGVAAAKSYADTQDAEKLLEAKSYADTKKSEALSYADLKKSEAIADAHAYADQVKSDLLGGAPAAALDTILELGQELANQESAVAALTTSIANNLQTAKDYADTQDAAKLVDAKAYADAAVLVEKNRAEGVEALKASFTYVDAQDLELQNSINTVAGQVSTALADAKSYADAAVLVEKNRAEAAEGVLTSSVSSVQSAQTTLQSDMDNLEGYALDLRSDLDQEVVDRGLAISNLESAVHSYADAAVLVEKTRAEGAEAALGVRVSALEVKTQAFEKEKFIAAAPLVSITLAHQVIEKSINAVVGRVSLTPDDYLVSVVDGKTVLTWQGDFAVGGIEAIEAGDIIWVSYAY